MKYKYKMVFVILILVNVILKLNISSEEQKTIRMLLGSDIYYALPEDVQTVSIGNEAIIRARATTDRYKINLTALSEGVTSMTITSSYGVKEIINIIVVKYDPNQIEADLKEILSDFEGVRTRIAGGKVVLEGHFNQPEEIDMFTQVVATYNRKDMIINAITVSPGLRRFLASKVEQNIGLPDVRVHILGQRVFLRGTVENEREQEIAFDMASAFFPEIVDLLRLRLLNEPSKERIIRQVSNEINIPTVDVYFDDDLLVLRGVVRNQNEYELAERIAESRNERVGNFLTIDDRILVFDVQVLEIKYSEGVDVNPARDNFSHDFMWEKSSGAGTNYRLQFTSKILSNIAYWVSEGRAEILAQPKLVVRNTGKASFHSGGQKAYQTRSDYRTEWKNYGIQLEVEPTLSSNNEVRMEIFAEVSGLEKGQADIMPDISTRNVRTDVTIPVGKTLILAGLLNRSNIQQVRRVPFIGRIPPFSFIYYNRNEIIEITEIVIVVTPLFEEFGFDQFENIQQGFTETVTEQERKRNLIIQNDPSHSKRWRYVSP